MAMGPIDFATIQRSQDVSQIKQNENMRPLVQQDNIQTEVSKQNMVKAESVNKKDDVDLNNNKFDAKEQSQNEYYNTEEYKKNGKKTKDKVFIKGQDRFDVKI